MIDICDTLFDFNIWICFILKSETSKVHSIFKLSLTVDWIFIWIPEKLPQQVNAKNGNRTKVNGQVNKKAHLNKGN